ncbi:MAG TPA: FlgD immunoglobulin-like domain containing protein [Bacteroidales bacterium]|nr:FlgD immunoglobulin-like domain containing protein [Bacteroidales bacterium]HRX95951.1 FlgD immunoglobulin-like domain containing protein [Bacteroidales bacterium]
MNTLAKISNLLLIFYSITMVHGAILTVKQDGTGDYTTIEAAITESAWNVGDTVLVWPGIYYEHLYYYGNHLTVASLYAINPDPSYIENTIIDGNQTGVCVTMKYGNDDLTINGFTVRNGSGLYGGGIYVNQASGVIKNCKIELNTASKYGGGICIDDAYAHLSNCVINNNSASIGGGIYTIYAHLYLSGTTIKFNQANGTGGGIYHGYQSYINFNADNKCNLYLNYGAPGTDYYKFYSIPPQSIVLDTCTVSNPDIFFFASYDGEGFPVNEVTVQWDHFYLEQTDQDLYVNPIWGNDENSGTSVNDPLKTIAFASLLINSDSLNLHKIYLSNGIYSRMKNEEKLPFCLKSYISLVGDNMDSIIIDADSLSIFVISLGYKTDITIKNVTFQNGKGGIRIFNNKVATLENVKLIGSVNGYNGLNCDYVDSLNIKNTTIEYYKGDFAVSISSWNGINSSFRFENVIINHNGPGYNTTSSILRGGGIKVIGQIQSPDTKMGHGLFSNVLISNNIRKLEPELTTDRTIAIDISGYYKINLVNSTIAHNVLKGPTGLAPGYGVSVSSNAELNIYNSNLFGNLSSELLLGASPYSSVCQLNYSDIEDGTGGITNWNSSNTLVWGEGNINDDPLWDTATAIPYAIPWNSPCINTGTPMYEFGMAPPYIIMEDTIYKLITYDYDTIALPANDLAGNMRIAGERIDMGAYEWPDNATEIKLTEDKDSKLEVELFPNPFNVNLFISFDLASLSQVRLLIYDLFGNEIKMLVDSKLPGGNYNLSWPGNDDSGNAVDNGIYFISIYADGKNMGSKKVVKISSK